ncbi:MAG: RNA polymerase-associated protein RapA [Xanthomonadales bacterium]|nr:RNA polymerase-associated protein RapA [Xanthomonadales bacterium]
MTVISFLPGQRWVSNTESELGLGLVIQATHRRVELVFPAAAERRLYAVDNAPLSRVQYQPGEQVRSETGQPLTIDAVMEANGCLIYSGFDEQGQAVILPERDLNSRVQFSKPQDRLFAGQIDKNRAFELRCETLEHNHRQQQSTVRGLLGPRVQLLPHQLYIASEVSRRYAPRVLLADEVGLGKTIEAGLILHQQLITGRAQRALIVVPDSLLHQWLVEMLRRFNLLFSIIDAARCEGLEDSAENPFESSQLVLCTLSFLRDHPAQLAQALATDWDLLIVDEAHHLHWSEEAASPAYRCIEALAKQARGLLLLTATPEQLGVASHFARLRLLDPDRYYDLQSFIAEEHKHQPVNRLVQDLAAADVRARLLQHDVQEQLRSYLGAAVVTPLLELARSEASEEFAAAVRAVMRDLLDRHGTGRVLFRNTRASVGGFPDRQLLRYPLAAPDDYIGNSLDATAEQLLAPEQLLGELWVEHDPRVPWLAQWLKQGLEQRRGEKVLVICAHATTAMALEEHLRLRAGTLSAVFHEGLSLLARDRAAAYFSDEAMGAQVLLCSEIGSEGRNFQFAHHLVLYDLPLNPDLLEQRIGRLDRIGQKHMVQIHVPYYAASAQGVLLNWYHEGLNAFEHICPAGQTLYQQFEADLRHCLLHAGDEPALAGLLQRTRDQATATLLALQQGRDRLLEMNSFNREGADRIMDSLFSEERGKEEGSQVLATYMEQLFAQFGVEQEHHSSNSLVLRPGAHMLVESFPALPEDGMTATYRRDLALSREDMHYLTWEHPLVSGAMDLVLNGEFGNATVCTLKLPPLKPTLKSGAILLEAIFSLSCVAPGELQLQRYLPQTTVRALLDGLHNDLSSILGSAYLNRRVQETPLHSARELVRHTRPQLTAMLAQAQVLAEARAAALRDAAAVTARTEQTIELERLQALAAVNPNIRPQEIQYLQEAAERLHGFIHSAQLRLDAIRVVVVTE